MKPIGDRDKIKKKKNHYYIILNGTKVGETWAVSPEKARTNYWWKYVKGEDEFSFRMHSPEDFDVVDANKNAKSTF